MKDRKWVSRKALGKPNNFDVQPPEGVELPPIGILVTPSGVPNAYFSYANNPSTAESLTKSQNYGDSKYGGSQSEMALKAGDMRTRHGRRIYAGNLPPMVTEEEIQGYFNEIVSKAIFPEVIEGGPVYKVYQNNEL